MKNTTIYTETLNGITVVGCMDDGDSYPKWWAIVEKGEESIAHCRTTAEIIPHIKPIGKHTYRDIFTILHVASLAPIYGHDDQRVYILHALPKKPITSGDASVLAEFGWRRTRRKLFEQQKHTHFFSPAIHGIHRAEAMTHILDMHGWSVVLMTKVEGDALPDDLA